MKERFWYRPLVVVGLLLAVLAFAGCSGDDGDDGKNGKSAYQIAVDNGFVGSEQDWLDSLQGEDVDPAVVDDLQDQIDDIDDYLTEEALPAHYQSVDSDANMTATVTSITNVDGRAMVAFTVMSGDKGVTGLMPDRIYLADIVPAGTETANWGTWSSDYTERWAYERDRAGYPLGEWTDLGDGNYTYHVATAFGSAEALAVAPDYDPTHVQRIVIRLGADGYNNAVAIQDFMVPGEVMPLDVAGNLLDPQSVKAPTNGCKNCHSDYMLGAAHAGGYLDTRACVVCHSPIGTYGDRMQGDYAYLAVFVHAIHAAKSAEDHPELEAWDEERFPNEEGEGQGYGAVTYPREIQDCAVCHTGDDNMTNDFLANPTMEVCGSCHSNIDWETGDGHEGGLQPDNNGCVYCHPASGEGFGQSVAGAHQIEDTLNYTASITLSADDDDTPDVYEPGDEILVTVTTSNIAAGNYNVEGIADRANLYVYGPRALALPVLATGSSTDGGMQQSHDILVTSADPQVRTDANGFKYQMLAIPEDLAPGTYMAMAYVTTDLEDCSAIYRGSVCVDGWTLTTFQVGTADPEPKVAGECTTCHNQSQWGAYYHRSYFGTDGCLACHDQSGNHADTIANRVHAVHGANTYGDYVLGIEDGETDIWEEITFPQSDVAESFEERTTARCQACHTSGNTSYKETMWTLACIGCHGEASGANLLHMDTMSDEDEGYAGSGSCATCHGAGKAFDINDVSD